MNRREAASAGGKERSRRLSAKRRREIALMGGEAARQAALERAPDPLYGQVTEPENKWETADGTRMVNCLKCGAVFRSTSKWNRICAPCRDENAEILEGSWLHSEQPFRRRRKDAA